MRKGYVLFALATMLPLIAVEDNAAVQATNSSAEVTTVQAAVQASTAVHTSIPMFNDPKVERDWIDVFTRRNTGIIGGFKSARELLSLTADTKFYVDTKFRTFPTGENIGMRHHVLLNHFIGYTIAIYTGVHLPELSALCSSSLFFGEIRRHIDARVLSNAEVLQAYAQGLKTSGDAANTAMAVIVENDLTDKIAEYNVFLRMIQGAYKVREATFVCSQRELRWDYYIATLKQFHEFGSKNESTYNPKNGILSMGIIRYDVYLSLLKEWLVAKLCHDIEIETPGVKVPASFADLDEYMKTKLLPGRGGSKAATLAITDPEIKASFFKAITDMIKVYRSDVTGKMTLTKTELDRILTPHVDSTSHQNIGIHECINFVNSFLDKAQSVIQEQHEEVRPTLTWAGGYNEFSTLISDAHANFAKSTLEYLQRRYIQAGKLILFTMGMSDAITAAKANNEVDSRYIQSDITGLSLTAIKEAIDKFMQVKATRSQDLPNPTHEVTPLNYIALSATERYKNWSEIGDETGRKSNMPYLESKALNHRPGDNHDILTEHVIKWNMDLLLTEYYNNNNSGLGKFVWRILVGRMIGVVKLAVQKYLHDYSLMCDLVFAPDVSGAMTIRLNMNTSDIVEMLKIEKKAKTDSASGISASARRANAKMMTNVMLTLYYLGEAIVCDSTAKYEAIATTAQRTKGFKSLLAKSNLTN